MSLTLYTSFATVQGKSPSVAVNISSVDRGAAWPPNACGA